MWHEKAWKWGRVWCGGVGEKKHPEMVSLKGREMKNL